MKPNNHISREKALTIPSCVLAASEPPSNNPHPLARPRVQSSFAKAMAEKLRKGEAVTLGHGGRTDDPQGANTVQIPKNIQLASNNGSSQNPHPLARPNVQSSLAKAMAEKLRKGEAVTLGQGGRADNPQGTNTVQIPKNTQLAAQWYERAPEMLEIEKRDMGDSIFSDFVLYRHRSGRLYWDGYITPGIMADGCWHVQAYYPENFPNPRIGGTMRVCLVDPTLRDIEGTLGATLHHVLYDDILGRYLCTAREQDIRPIMATRTYGMEYTGAVASLILATKWLTGLELVLTGHMSFKLFNSQGGI